MVLERGGGEAEADAGVGYSSDEDEDGDEKGSGADPRDDETPPPPGGGRIPVPPPEGDDGEQDAPLTPLHWGAGSGRKASVAGRKGRRKLSMSLESKRERVEGATAGSDRDVGLVLLVVVVVIVITRQFQKSVLNCMAGCTVMINIVGTSPSAVWSRSPELTKIGLKGSK